MSYESDILEEENKIALLQQTNNSILIPRRSINFQHQNLRFGGRRISNDIILMKHRKRSISNEIACSMNRVKFLNGELIKQRELEIKK